MVRMCGMGCGDNTGNFNIFGSCCCGAVKKSTVYYEEVSIKYFKL